jgi:glycosyltransferase involved in cell wall biosynthesis
MTPLQWLVMAHHVPAGGAGGGMVRYVNELVTALHRRDDVAVHVACTQDAADWWAELLGADAVHPSTSMPTTAAAIRDMAGWGIPGGFDVLHGAKHLLPKPRLARVHLLTVHDMLPLDRPRDFPPAKRLFLRRPYLDSLRRADLLLSVSEATRNRLVSYLPEVADRVQVVPLAPSDAVLCANPEPIPDVEPGRFVLTVGDHSPRKNQAMLLAGWRRLQDIDRAGKLVWVGPPGWGVDPVDTDTPNVIRLGHISDELLSWGYRNAAAVAVPSLLEGFGLPAAEARGMGTPLITSEDEALAEAAGHDAAVADSTDPTEWAAAMAAALHRPALAAQPGAAPVRSWDDVAAEGVTAVRNLLVGDSWDDRHG